MRSRKPSGAVGFSFYYSKSLYSASITGVNTSEIRSKYLEFFKSKGHAIVPSAPLVPENDPTTLFTGSGMQPMLPYFLGQPHPLGKRVADSQKSFRAQDIEEVGDNRHTTFFEMLGNWSFGDYFKQEQIPWMFEFLTTEIGLDPKRLYFTCHAGNEALGIPRDTEAAGLWVKLLSEKGVDAQIAEDAETKGTQGARIFYYGDKKNWWSRAGVPENMPEGEPGGPDTEMFWDFGIERGLHEESIWKDEPCHVNCDCGRFLEIGNNVFMQYVKKNGAFEKLPAPNVDFGGGLERIAAALNDDPDVFKTDLFQNLREAIERVSGREYGKDEKMTRAFRVVMDHLRASVFLIGDGVIPSNTDQGYVLRRLLRRAIRFSDILGVQEGNFHMFAEGVIDTYAADYKELGERRAAIVEEIRKEEEKFRETLQKGLKEFSRRTGDHVSGLEAFNLYQSYGFPIEVTEELAAERGLEVDRAGFNEEMKKHQDLSRAGSEKKFKGGLAGHSDIEVKYHTATHLLHKALRTVLGENVQQKGSNITPERLRFDFAHPQKMTPEEIAKVEALVNEKIQEDLEVVREEVSLEEARNRGAIGLFGEKYGDTVSIYTVMGKDGKPFSLEFCGGPHVTRTGEMGVFKISKEEAVSAGVRRIKAVLESR
ncbi:alanine--tRNA ligase [Candidatus Parcubacteria bacterium]|nr:alanine--tRNA ligase [Candidatus Parcubacteria bacterium]